MEQSRSRLYSGPLSQAAQKILVVLRSQSLHAARRGHQYLSNHRQMERYYDSQWEPWALSSRSMSQEEGDRNIVRPWSRPQVSSSTHLHDPSNYRQSSQTLAYYQYSETTDSSLLSQASNSSSCRDSSLQRLPFQTEACYQCSQTYSHRNYSEPAAYQSRQALSFTQQDISEVAASFFPRDRYTSSLSVQKRHSEHQATLWGTPTEDIRSSSAVEDGDVLYQQSKSDTTKIGKIHLSPRGFVTRQDIGCDAYLSKPMRNLDGEEELELMVNSESMTEAGAGQMSDIKQEMEDEVNTGTLEERDVILPTKTRLTSEMEGVLLLETNLENNLYLVSTSNMDKSTDCNTWGEKLSEKEVDEYNISAYEHPSGSEIKVSVDCDAGSPAKVSPSVITEDHKVSPCQAETPQVLGWPATETEKDLTETPRVHCGPNKLVLGDTTADDPERTTEEKADVMEVGLKVEKFNRTKTCTDSDTEEETDQPQCSDVQLKGRLYIEVKELAGGDTEPGGSEKDNESVMTHVDSETESTLTDHSWNDSCPMPAVPQHCRARGSVIKAPCLSGNWQHGDNVQTAGSIRESSSSVVLAAATTFSTGQNSPSVHELASTLIKPREKLEKSHLPISQTLSQRPLILSLKRKHEVLERQNLNRPSKIYLTRHPPKWVPPHSSQEKAGEGGANEWKRARPTSSIPEHAVEPQTNSHQTKILSGVHTTVLSVLEQTQQRQSKIKERGHESVRNTSKQTPSSVAHKPTKHKQAKCEPDQAKNRWANSGEPQPHSTAGSLTATLTSDPRVKDSGTLNPDERMQMLKEAMQAKALVLTMVYQDGSTQLDPEQKLTTPVCGLLVLMKNDHDCNTPEDLLRPNDRLVYLKLEQTPAWAKRHPLDSQNLFTRDMLLRVLSRSELVVCYKAKDLLRTALQFYKQDLDWKKVAGCHIQDPQVSGWLLDPADPSSCYWDLLSKHCKRPPSTPAMGTKKVSQVISGLSALFWLNMELCAKLQSQGLWELYSEMELKMIPVLAAMESHCIHVDKEALNRTSNLLGTKMKQLEQEAHQAAGQKFLVTSSTQLRTVLFEKLRLHERCENKKLPKTINKQQQSTSEAVLLQLQDLHPLPKIILEYRQVHKIKSTFVDGILSCMMSKNYISSTWSQTSAVTGRISAKHPNFQALPRQPLQITKMQYIQGREEEVVTVHPRAMFIPQESWTFLAADFCQVELRLLAHLSSDPELLRVFTNPQADVFAMLASQ
nr:DNA polymerase nu isoform X2 [Monopterus albus]